MSQKIHFEHPISAKKTSLCHLSPYEHMLASNWDHVSCKFCLNRKKEIPNMMSMHWLSAPPPTDMEKLKMRIREDEYLTGLTRKTK